MLELPHVFSWGDFIHFPGLLGLAGKLSWGVLGRPLLWSQITSLKGSLFSWPKQESSLPAGSLNMCWTQKTWGFPF